MVTGARKIVDCQKKEGSRINECDSCKKPINVGDFYTAYGIRATTASERFYARKGNVWYYHCPICTWVVNINSERDRKMNNTRTKEIPIEVTRNGKDYEIVVEMRGEWSGYHRPATRLDPEEFAEFDIYDFKFLEAPGLIEDVVAENSADAFQWLRISESYEKDTDDEVRIEVLEISVEFAGKTLDVSYFRRTPFDNFELSPGRMFIFELEDHVLNLMNEEGEWTVSY